MAAEMKAELIGQAALTDLQLTVPRRPALRRGVRLRRSGDSVVLDGADRMQAFSGEFAREWLVPLAEACDGTRDHAALADGLGLPESAVHTCLALLWTAGAVEEATPDEEPPVAPELACFLSRLGNSTGVNATWADAAARLARRPVALEGDPALVGAARRALRGVCPVVTGDTDPAGGGHPTEHPAEHPATDPPKDPATDPAEHPPAFTVFFETVASAPLLADAEKACRRDGRPLLRVRADAATIVVGPYVDPAITPCLECGRHGEAELAGEPAAHQLDLVAGVAAHHITAVLARATVTHLPIDSSVIDTATLATSYRPATTRPGCPECSHARGPVAPEAPASAVYEAAVAIPPRAFLDPKGHQAHYYTANIRLQSQFRQWPSRVRTPLPAADLSALAGPGHRGGTPLTPHHLGLVLKIAFGLKDDETTPERVKRWTAASGNIGCTTAYVVVRDASVLPPGVYAYAEGSHTLASVSRTVPPGDSPCDIVVTGDLKKVMSKYGTFGFRLALLDSGCALTSARHVARHLGLDFAPRTDWDDDALTRILDVSPTEEPVVAVASLGGTA
ncbi:nitroreductase family protein [Streptomyces yaizuensis]|uniref:TpaE n=1 Tax=Streptomyces yaizuensis TaxID=2989713 RepID=A0ABQ5P493_9ACTN|nr:nitroreductase family protein [Streptomyces sp. YSPA8]GLF97392.1 tpaE [Streptomyces sp. YSPA8]